MATERQLNMDRSSRALTCNTCNQSLWTFLKKRWSPGQLHTSAAFGLLINEQTYVGSGVSQFQSSGAIKLHGMKEQGRNKDTPKLFPSLQCFE